MKFGCYLLHILCLGKGILKVMTSARKLTLANSSLLSDFCHLNVMFVCLLPEKARQMEGYVIFSWREIAQDDGVAIFVAYKNMLTVNLKKP